MIGTNNPGNLRSSKGFKWQGEVGDNKGYCVFDTMNNGVRALAKNLLTYQRRYGLRTVKDIITRWAPPNENNTDSYIAYVSQKMCVGPEDIIDLNDLDTLEDLVNAIIWHENGVSVDASVVDFGIKAAMLS